MLDARDFENRFQSDCADAQYLVQFHVAFFGFGSYGLQGQYSSQSILFSPFSATYKVSNPILPALAQAARFPALTKRVF